MKFKVKPIFNKKNGQINISLPKKKLSKKIIDFMEEEEYIKIKLFE